MVYPWLMQPIRTFLTGLPLTASVRYRSVQGIQVHFSSHTAKSAQDIVGFHHVCAAMLDACSLRLHTGNHLGVALAVHATVVAHCPSLVKMWSALRLCASKIFEDLCIGLKCGIATWHGQSPFRSLWHIGNVDKTYTRRSRSHMLSLSHPLEMVPSPKTSTTLPSFVGFFLLTPCTRDMPVLPAIVQQCSAHVFCLT